jgi:hypothetical protein
MSLTVQRVEICGMGRGDPDAGKKRKRGMGTWEWERGEWRKEK